MSVVVSYLPSPEGEAALARAAREARADESTLVVVPSRGAGQSLDASVAALQAEGLTVEVVVPQGADVTDALLDIARTWSADLLVIGLRRRSAVGKLILGSHAQRVLLDADCDVLSVKP